MNVDPAASMRCWAVDVEVGGQVYTVPPLAAADWWSVLTDGASVLDLIPVGHDIDDQLMDEKISGRDLESAFRDALEEICGRPIQQAETIARVAIGGWGWIGGALALAGFRWDVMPLSAALDALHATILERLGEEDRKKYEALIRQAAPTKLDRSQAISDFEAAAGPRPTAAVSTARSSAAQSSDSPARTRQPSRPPRRRAPSGEPTTPPG